MRKSKNLFSVARRQEDQTSTRALDRSIHKNGVEQSFKQYTNGMTRTGRQFSCKFPLSSCSCRPVIVYARACPSDVTWFFLKLHPMQHDFSCFWSDMRSDNCLQWCAIGSKIFKWKILDFLVKNYNGNHWSFREGGCDMIFKNSCNIPQTVWGL